MNSTPTRPRTRRQTRLSGIAIVPGIGIGPVTFAEEPALAVSRHKIAATDIAAELHQFEAAAAMSRRQLDKLNARLAILPEAAQVEIAPLIEAHIHMLGQSRLMRAIRAAIAERLVSAATAVSDVAEDQATAMLVARRGTDDGAMKRQAEEIREIGRRLLRNLTQLPFRSFADLPQGGILVVERLRPSDAALINPAQFAGIATEDGAADDHTAVMLRAIGVPAVLGVTGLVAAARQTATIVLDGETGMVLLNPSADSLNEAARLRTGFTRAQRSLARLKRLTSETTDHVGIELQTNLELPFELPMVAQSGASGIGLMRTEFLFMNREVLPDEDVQFETYREAVLAMDGDPVTIRLLDWGGDKQSDTSSVSELIPGGHETNPALGLRGVRLLLQHPALLDTQLAAMLRAAAFGSVRIMIPMVSRLSEVTQVRQAMDRIWRQLAARQIRLPALPPPLGVMIETPAAAINAGILAREAAFFAIGTNDLTMYTLAIDRAKSSETALYDPLDPAVLRLIAMTIAAGREAGVPVSLCGELASRAETVPLLIGLGLRQFSMHGGAVLRIKRAVRATDTRDCGDLAAAALAAPGAEAVHALIG
ncbi:MAG: phosphoenolpyruvate--protein phosphotransferase [Acidiphilium sp.]|nr:phosphoenolpyruvate--protein phosphotransferase [Acidiphilium sp.]MDD4935552.1 phosphoenolpyruvate--protein phosphotransferase [Acidiphilium sp.]